MSIFKLERERPAFDLIANKCYYIKERYLRSYDYSNNRDVPLVSLRRTNTSTGTSGSFLQTNPRVIYYNVFNKTENNILLLSDNDGGSYELITFTETSGSGSLFVSVIVFFQLF